ncbi:hypothetical protein AXF42_Ash013471 [Apostasia shenzhenica]|uniref:KIB1-4 beta-propeller domain-containing protein n=1 Tax=Apostasia shenzhenica TaxID=1088818 RepID=A0A2I0A4B5_9ASPA|nr:hypothetical protein AXF42_Ash013471 [Apostasia shenzhenica]
MRSWEPPTHGYSQLISRQIACLPSTLLPAHSFGFLLRKTRSSFTLSESRRYRGPLPRPTTSSLSSVARILPLLRRSHSPDQEIARGLIFALLNCENQLVESTSKDELWLVTLKHNTVTWYNRKIEFPEYMIFKFNERGLSWEKVETMGDEALLIGKSSVNIVSTSKIPSLKRNCIYNCWIPYSFEEDEWFHGYDYEEGEEMKSYQLPKILVINGNSDEKDEPIWIVPQLNLGARDARYEASTRLTHMIPCYNAQTHMPSEIINCGIEIYLDQNPSPPSLLHVAVAIAGSRRYKLLLRFFFPPAPPPLPPPYLCRRPCTRTAESFRRNISELGCFFVKTPMVGRRPKFIGAQFHCVYSKVSMPMEASWHDVIRGYCQSIESCSSRIVVAASLPDSSPVPAKDESMLLKGVTGHSANLGKQKTKTDTLDNRVMLIDGTALLDVLEFVPSHVAVVFDHDDKQMRLPKECRDCGVALESGIELHVAMPSHEVEEKPGLQISNDIIRGHGGGNEVDCGL